MNEYKKDIVRDYTPLTKAVQKSLYTKMRRGDTDARDQLIGSCLPLVIDLAKKFYLTNKHVDLDDLVQEGNLALIKAVDNWDMKKSVLTTLATHYVKRALINMIYDSNYHIKTSRQLSRNAARQLCQIKKTNLTQPSEISQETGIPEKTVVRLLSFSRESRHRKTHQRGATWEARNSDVIQNISDLGYKEKLQQEICPKQFSEICQSTLTKEEHSLIRYSYGIDHPRLTLKKISEKVNYSMKKVRNNIRVAERKIKKAALEL